MWTLAGISLLYLVPAFANEANWQNHNCPAPRSPSNGISFIFHDGALVRYRCHPGYVMRGRTYARCIKNKWDSHTPLCIHRNEIQMEEFRSRTSYTTMPKREPHYTVHHPSSTSRSLFDWEKESHTPPYGDGPNRLPVINGIWKTSERPSSHLFTIGSDNHAAKDLIREEIGIAEVRQKQLEEVQRTRTGYKTIPKYRSVEDSNPTKPRYHGSISVVVLPPAPENQKLDNTTKRPKRKKERKQKGKNKGNKKGKNKDKHSSAAFRHKPEETVSTKTHGGRDYWWSDNNSVHQRGSRPYKSSPLTSRPSQDQMMGDLNSSQYDDTCYEVIRGRRIPMRAPPLPNAFVYKYDSRKHYFNPDTHYLIVHYQCRHGYKLFNKEANKLYCQNGQWVGETPLCQ